MSLFFADQDNITFGVQGSNEIEVAQFSSTLDDVRLRLYTNNSVTEENLSTGIFIGSSNYDKSGSLRNNLYFAHLSNVSNVEKIMVMEENRIGINTASPSATLHVVGSNLGYSNILLIEAINSPAYPALTIDKYGWVGIGTDPVANSALTVAGTVVVENLQVGLGGAAGGDASLLATQGLRPITGDYLRFANASFSNVTNIQLTDTLYASNIAPFGSGNYVQFNNATLSNIANLTVNAGGFVQTDNITGRQGNLVKFNNNTLSNISDLQANKATVQTITSQLSEIDVSGKSLCNVNTVRTVNLEVTNVTSLNDTINVSQKTLSNLNGVRINTGSTLFTNSVDTNSGSAIGFNNKDLTDINNLTIAGDIRVRGEFFVLNTTTCNTNQMQIQNDGTGPALVVNQLGANHIASFQDDSNVVFFIKDGGQAAFGNFGTEIDTNIPASLVYIDNSAFSNQTGLYVDQHHTSADVLRLNGSGGNSIVVNTRGNLGIGTATPNVPIAIYDTSAIKIPAGTTTERPSAPVAGYIRYNSETQSFEGFGPNSQWGSLGGVKDVDGNTYISAEASPGANDNNLRFFTDGTEKMVVTADGNVGIGTTSAAALVHVSKTTAGDIFRVDDAAAETTPFIINDVGNVGIGTNVPLTELDVRGTARAPTVEVQFLSTTAVSQIIDVTTKTLSNITTVSVAKLTSDADNINVSGKSLSNVTTASVAKLTSDVDNINVSGKSLSNVTTVSVAKFTSDVDNINVSGKSLSNVTTVSVAKFTSDVDNINVSGKSLSNVTTVSVAKFTSDVDNINVSGKSLSNVTTASVTNLTSDLDNINVSTKSLSNISTISAVYLTSDNSNLNVSARSLSNITTVSIANITSDVANINVSTKSLSNVVTVSLSNITSDGLNINVSGKSLSNINTASVAKLTSDNDNINVSGKSLSNISTASVVYLTSDNANINVSGKSLSNISTASVVYLTSDNANIDVSGKSLSNITTASVVYLTSDNANINVSAKSLSNISTASVANLTSDGLNINVSGKSLSNISTASVANLTSDGANINVSTKSLSNVKTVSVSNITSDLDNINVSTKSLSNINTVSAVYLTSDNANLNVSNKSLSNISTVSLINLTSDNDNINVNSKSLSNITTTVTENLTASGLNINVSGKSLSNITTASVAKLTSDAANINVSGKSLSNITTASVTNLTSDGLNINVSGKSLSNVTTVSIANLTSDGSNINVSTKSLSNITTVSLIHLTTDGANIDVSAKSLSNLSSVSTEAITAEGLNINVSGKSLSNITTASVANLTSDLANINVNAKSLSNISTASIVNLTSDLDNINVSAKSLSNITTVSLVNLTSDNLNINVNSKSLSNITTASLVNLTSSVNNINVSGKSLSNVTTLSVANITSDVDNLNINTKSLSNITTVDATNVRTTKLTTTAAGGLIDVDMKSLSNLNGVYVNTASKVYTNDITTYSGSTIDFNDKNVIGISNLNVIGDITVRGEFFVMQTTTCNTDQFIINNDGTGPALVVNQKGAEHILQVSDDGDTVFFIKDGGQAAFGSFGPAIEENIPYSLVYMANPTASNQKALYITQDNPSQDTMYLDTMSCNMVFTGAGRFGIGTDVPTARFQMSHVADTNIDFMRISAGAQTNAFVIGPDGHVGIGTAPSTTKALVINGVIEADNIVVGGGGGSGTLMTAYGMTAAGGRDYLEFNYMDFSNVDVIKANYLHLTSNGTAALPAYSFDSDQNTGIFTPASDNLAFTTAGTEQVRILGDGNVGIGVTNAATKLEVSGTVRAPRVDVNTLTTVDPSNIINVNTTTLSNVTTISVANLTSDALNINVSAKSLSNIATASVVKLTSDADNINVSAKSLSNVSTVSVVNITSDGLNINVTAKSLSNIATASVAKLTSDADNINVSTKSLSNISTVSVANITSEADNINMSAKSLSNIATASVAKLTSDADNINVSTKSLSNIATVSVAKITSDANNINISSKSLSNVTTVSVVNLTSDTDNINVSTKSLSNVTTVSLANITSEADNINISTKSLSNVTTVSVVNLTSDLDNINVSTKSLSNVTTVSVANLTSDNLNINVNAKSLSNLATLETQNVKTNRLTTVAAGGLINVDAKSLSNLNGVYINTGSKVYTNDITTFTGSTINMNNNDVTNIKNLTVNGQITVNGEFFVMDTTTCNTNQLQIQNDGTGPALIVNQLGANDIATFQDDSNVVFFIKDGGQAAFGSFGTSIPSIPSTQVYVQNVAASNQEALYVQQDNAGYNLLKMVGTASSDVVVSAAGKVGLNVATPSARIEIAHTDAGTEAFRYGASNQANAFIIGASGSVGIGTAVNAANALTASGVVEANTMRMDTITAYGQNINVSNKTLSNVALLKGTDVNVNAVTTNILTTADATNVINVSQKTLSNVDRMNTATLQVSTIQSLVPNINVSTRTLSNVGSIQGVSASLTTELSVPSITSHTSDISFNFKRVLDVDSLVVRSNISVLFTGTDTYSNLPTDVVRLDGVTGKILDSYISSNIVRLMNNGLINANLLPPVETERKTLMHTRDRVGIGLRNPQQKLHVHGTQAITSGRLGIGTPNPSSVLHILDDNGAGPTVRIEQQGTVDVMQIVGSNSAPLLYINANNSVGVGTSAPETAYKLDVGGKIRAQSGVRTPSLESSSGTINCSLNSLSNVLHLNVENVVVGTSLSIPSSFTASNMDVYGLSADTINARTTAFIDSLAAVRITGYDTNLYEAPVETFGSSAYPTRIGLKVTNNILTTAVLSPSDERIKTNVQVSSGTSDLQTVLSIPVYTFDMIDNAVESRTQHGFIAQEVEQYAPFAVNTTVNAVPDVMTRPEAIESNGYQIRLRDHGLYVGDVVKVLVDNVEVVTKVKDTTMNTIMLERPLPANATPQNVFIYGRIVNDFKVINSERLLPLVFNAVKEMNRQMSQQQIQLQNLLMRVQNLESKF